MNYINKVTALIIPRPGEKEIGFKAYKDNEEKFLEKYKFDD